MAKNDKEKSKRGFANTFPILVVLILVYIIKNVKNAKNVESIANDVENPSWNASVDTILITSLGGYRCCYL